MKNLPSTKKGKILAYLKEGKTLTHLQAVDLFRHSRLASCICRLRKEGFNIDTIMCYTKDREPYGEYKMITS